MDASVARSGTRRTVSDHPSEFPATVVAAFGGPARFASHFRKWTAQAMQHVAPLVFPSGVKNGSMSSFEATALERGSPLLGDALAQRLTALITTQRAPTPSTPPSPPNARFG